MSQVAASALYVIATALGNMGVSTVLRTEFDVEDIIRDRAYSQGRVIQFVNLGQQIDDSINVSPAALPTVFKDLDSGLIS